MASVNVSNLECSLLVQLGIDLIDPPVRVCRLVVHVPRGAASLCLQAEQWMADGEALGRTNVLVALQGRLAAVFAIAGVLGYGSRVRAWVGLLWGEACFCSPSRCWVAAYRVANVMAAYESLDNLTGKVLQGLPWRYALRCSTTAPSIK